MIHEKEGAIMVGIKKLGFAVFSILLVLSIASNASAIFYDKTVSVGGNI
jgi:hypothetical protein